MKHVEVEYIESGTFQGGEEDTFTAGIKHHETCIVLKRKDCAALIADKKRLNWLESTVTGTGKSAFDKSAFIVSQGEEIALDVKTEPVVHGANLRAAIDEAMKQQTTPK